MQRSSLPGLRTTAVLVLGTLAVMLAAAFPAAEAQPVTKKLNPIQIENSKPGSTDWQLTRVMIDRQRSGRHPLIEGYCSHQSVQVGDQLKIMVSTNPPAKFKIEIFRTGYYNGRGARLVQTIDNLVGKTQPDPKSGERSLHECQWEPSATITIPKDWTSGVYLGRLTTLPDDDKKPYWQSYVIFIVRDERPADILFQCSDNTWQAYNRWPGQFSLYTDGTGKPPKSKVSFDRPYVMYVQIYDNPQSVGSGEWLCFEFPMAYWLEQHGYDVTYCSNSDMLKPDRALKCKAFLSVGHDEYWDTRQYHSVMKLKNAGVNLLFFCGNAIAGVTPFEPSSDGRPNRIIYKAGSFRSHGLDEGQIMGARNVRPVNGGGDWIVTAPHHWIFEGTGMKKGDRVRGLVGWEYHGDPPKDLPGLKILAEGTAFRHGTKPQQWCATIYDGPKDNFIFNAATIFWSQGLSSPPGHMLPWSHWSRPHGPDDRVQRITRNLLERAIRSAPHQ